MKVAELVLSTALSALVGLLGHLYAEVMELRREQAGYVQQVAGLDARLRHLERRARIKERRDW